MAENDIPDYRRLDAANLTDSQLDALTNTFRYKRASASDLALLQASSEQKRVTTEELNQRLADATNERNALAARLAEIEKQVAQRG